MIRNRCSELAQTNNRVVSGVQVGELLAQELLQAGHIGQGEVVSRGERLRSRKSHTQEGEQTKQPCRHTEETSRGVRIDRCIS